MCKRCQCHLASRLGAGERTFEMLPGRLEITKSHVDSSQSDTRLEIVPSGIACHDFLEQCPRSFILVQQKPGLRDVDADRFDSISQLPLFGDVESLVELPD